MTSTEQAERRTPVWVIAGISGIFGLLYAFAVWNGIAQLVLGLQAGAELTPILWAMWLLTIVLPIAVYAGVFAMTRRRGAGVLTLLFVVGLTVVGVFWMNVLAYVTSVSLSSLLVG